MPAPSPLSAPEPRPINPGYGVLNERFDRVVVITLRRATERHAQFAAALEGLRYEVVFGHDKRDLDLVQLRAEGVYDPVRARKLHRQGREMTVGEVACALSHLQVWRQVAEGPDDRVLIFEDDAVPSFADLGWLAPALEELPASWGLLYLGYDRNEKVTVRRRLNQLAYVALGATGLFYLTAREASRMLPRPHSRWLRRAGMHDFTHAYAITRAAARRLIEFQRPIALSVDTAIARVIARGEIEAYLTEPKAFHQSGFDSYIRTGER